MNALKKLSAAAIVLTGAMSTNVSAAQFNLFSISEDLSGTANIIDANKMVGLYNEATTITSFDAVTGTGTFQTSLLWRLGQMQNVDTGFTWGGVSSDQPLTQGIYALFQAGGTVTSIGGSTQFNFDSSGVINELQVWYDAGNNTSFFPFATSQPADGTTFYTPTAGGVGDILLATGAVLSGNGNQTCVGDENCGSYGVRTTFELTDDGKNYFVDPSNPFYEIAFSTGQFNGIGITEGLTTYLNGSQDVTFERIPEPTTVALMGLGLVGLGLRRRKNVA